ncbi:DUF551 domain-containing protein [Escherichia coli]
MSTITKEQLRERAREKVKSLEFIVTQTAFADSRAELEEELELARIALASLEAEAVITVGDDGGDALAYRRLIQTFAPGTKLYTAPPAPVSVPDDVSGPLAHAYKELTPTFMRNHIDIFERYGIYPDGSAGIQAMRIALDGVSRRAAMLQGADGNSPVIQDGWVACSERMPDPDSAFRVCAYTHTPHEDVRFRFVPASLFKSVCRDATHWQYMLPPAAPQQEV